MNLALIIGGRQGSLQELAGKLNGLGLQVETRPRASAIASDQALPRVLLLDEDAIDALAGPVPIRIAAAPIRLAVSASDASIQGVQAVLQPPATEEALLQALLDAGYRLPADAECAAIPGALHDLVDGDQAVVAELIDSLLSTGQTDLADYRARCAEGDWAAAGSLAHRIKGTARMAGCASLTRVCERIESASRSDAGPVVLRLNAIFTPGVQRLCNVLRSLQVAP
ncbi:Hpt domain-containing protein [Achromobacter deleyi]|uniref:Hpt domain-containing protein n=1 Tax=Achromobacter deleyi TaxID=1353891 RepID=UPI001490DD47|nr:Hpt domain-containing protein [Achromobacter deleyi]QVQ26827.1 Hpt domain-containing protein [Achromobacter deleyi]UIP22403.1 Hpt domain-containing protein [Achromobacter deleyi]